MSDMISVQARKYRRASVKIRDYLNRNAWPLRSFIDFSGMNVDVYNGNVPVANINITVGHRNIPDGTRLTWYTIPRVKKQYKSRSVHAAVACSVREHRLDFEFDSFGAPDVSSITTLIIGVVRPTADDKIVPCQLVPLLCHRRYPQATKSDRVAFDKDGAVVTRPKIWDAVRTVEQALDFLVQHCSFTADKAVACRQAVCAGSQSAFRNQFYSGGSPGQLVPVNAPLWRQICRIFRAGQDPAI